MRIDARLPVMLITGYLGSGKTTLLNRLLAAEEFRDAAVAINEFGEAGLDAAFLEHYESEALTIAGGCACCVLKSDFEDQLLQIYSRARNRAQPLRRLMIEMSGIADPVPLIQFLIGNPLASKVYRIEKVVCTVDTVFGGRQLTSAAEAVDQVVSADVLVMTKADLAPSGQDELTGMLRALNPRAEIMSAVEGRLDPRLLLSGGAPTGDSPISDVERWLFGSRSSPQHGSSSSAAAGQRFSHRESVTSYTLTADQPLDFAAFSRWLSALRVAHSEQLLRIKGVIHLAHRQAPVAVHGVHHIFHRMVELSRWPQESRRSTIVFIVRSLDRSAVEQGWMSLVAPTAGDRLAGSDPRAEPVAR